MSITRAFESKKQSKQFKKDYESGALDTEVICNLFHDRLEWSGELMFLTLMLEMQSAKVLNQTLGPYDFSFEGNRTYRNWVLSFEGAQMIVPEKREVVLDASFLKWPQEEKINLLRRFEHEFYNTILKGLDLSNLSDKDHQVLQKAHDAGVIKEGSIVFPAPSPKRKFHL